MITFSGSKFIKFQAMLLHYPAVITLTGDYFVIGCNRRWLVGLPGDPIEGHGVLLRVYGK